MIYLQRDKEKKPGGKESVVRKLVRPIKGDRKSQGRESKDRKSQAGSLNTSEGLQNKTGSAPAP